MNATTADQYAPVDIECFCGVSLIIEYRELTERKATPCPRCKRSIRHDKETIEAAEDLLRLRKRGNA